jgi:hypothetical protein
VRLAEVVGGWKIEGVPALRKVAEILLRGKSSIKLASSVSLGHWILRLMIKSKFEINVGNLCFIILF